MKMKQEFEEKFTHLNNLGGNRSMATVNADRVWQWIETKIDEAKEEGFNAGCDYTCKQYGDGKTEAQIIDEACKLKWISVKDRLPEKGQQVLAYNPTDKEEPFWVDYLFLNANKELRWDMGMNEVTHWMTLPESPKESE